MSFSLGRAPAQGFQFAPQALDFSLRLSRPFLGSGQPSLGCGVVKPQFPPLALQVQAQHLARQPALDRGYRPVSPRDSR